MADIQKKLKIVMVGGGSAGPAAPLLAVAEQVKQLEPRARFLFIGTELGPNRRMAVSEKIPFVAVTAGKWRRYWSLYNLLTPFQVLMGFFQAIRILRAYGPHAILGAGGFVQVPVLWAGWALRIPVMIHQQDVIPSLANTLCAPIAKKITVTFAESEQDFRQGLGLYQERQKPKVFWTGNPCRSRIFEGDKDKAIKEFHLEKDLSTLLVLGGGTGAQAINKLLIGALPILTKRLQIIHATGADKKTQVDLPRYHSYEFLNNVEDAYAAADIVISRAGLSAITELSNLQKLSIIIPIPDSHQEANAGYLWRIGAAVVADQRDLDSQRLARIVLKILYDRIVQQDMRKFMHLIMPKQSALKVAEHLLTIVL